MYCPKCGAENQEDLAYCRECGEDLKIISQAMKKHLPIALVSKLDALFEKKNERLHRDAILFGLAGPILLFSSVFISLGDSFFNIFYKILIFLIGIFYVYGSGISFLAYHRSLELRKRPLNTSVSDESLPSDISQVEALPSATEATTNKLVAVNDSQVASIYCPRCGVQNLENLLYCRDCGTSLDFSSRPQGMERYLPAFLVNKLDAMIAKNEETENKPQYKSGGTLLFVAVSFLSNVIIAGLRGDWGSAALWLAIGFVLAITGGWELIAYRRNLEKENKVLDEPSTSFADEFLTFLLFNWKIAVAIFGGMLITFGLLYFEIARETILMLYPPIILVAIIIFVASYLKFRQNLRSREDKEYLADTSDLPTTEFPPSDTLPLELSPPLSITEVTTKPLGAEVKQIEQVEIPVAKNTVNPRR